MLLTIGSMLMKTIFFIPANQERKIIPEVYRTLALDLDELKASLVNTPIEFTFAAQHNPKHIILPMPNGR